MKLNDGQIKRTSAQVGVEPLPTATTAHGLLRRHLGNHTFYLGPSGAFVWEPVGDRTAVPVELRALRVASWADDQRTLLQKQSPAPMGKAVTLD